MPSWAFEPSLLGHFGLRRAGQREHDRLRSSSRLLLRSSSGMASLWPDIPDMPHESMTITHGTTLLAPRRLLLRLLGLLLGLLEDEFSLLVGLEDPQARRDRGWRIGPPGRGFGHLADQAGTRFGIGERRAGKGQFHARPALAEPEPPARQTRDGTNPPASNRSMMSSSVWGRFRFDWAASAVFLIWSGVRSIDSRDQAITTKTRQRAATRATPTFSPWRIPKFFDLINRWVRHDSRLLRDMVPQALGGRASASDLEVRARKNQRSGVGTAVGSGAGAASGVAPGTAASAASSVGGVGRLGAAGAGPPRPGSAPRQSQPAPTTGSHHRSRPVRWSRSRSPVAGARASAGMVPSAARAHRRRPRSRPRWILVRSPLRRGRVVEPRPGSRPGARRCCSTGRRRSCLGTWRARRPSPRPFPLSSWGFLYCSLGDVGALGAEGRTAGSCRSHPHHAATIMSIIVASMSAHLPLPSCREPHAHHRELPPRNMSP